MMMGERCKLWPNSDAACYTSYLISNSGEIEPNRKYPAVILCGSGGYLRISEREREPVVHFFLSHGYQVFVLEYSTKSTGASNYPIPLFDLAQMVRTVRECAEEWNVDPHGIAVAGFSSGGHLCASLATQWDSELLSKQFGCDPLLLRPDAVVLCYPLLDYLYQRQHFLDDPDKNAVCPSKGLRKGDYLEVMYEAGVGMNATEEQFRVASPINHVTASMPPVFLWHTAQDELIYVGQSIRFAQLLDSCGVPFELHIFELGAHGLVLADRRTSNNPSLVEPDTARWAELAIAFLNRHLKITDGVKHEQH